MLSIMTEGLLSAIITGVGNLVNSFTNNILQDRAISRQNDYNTPASQMHRFQAAGLSPNLIYGTGQASAGNQTALGNYRGTDISTSDAVNMANAILSFRNMDANTQKAKAEARGIELDNTHKITELMFYNDRLNLENELKRLDVLYKSGSLTTQQYQQRVLLAQLDNINSSTALNKFNRETYYPTLLSIQRQNANTAAGQLQLGRDRLGWDMNPWNPNYRSVELMNQLRFKDIQHYDQNNFLNFLRTVVPWYKGPTF